MKYTRTIFLIITPLLLVSNARSQSNDWETVQSLRTGTKIKVTLKNRPTFGHCFLDGVSDDQLVCSSGKGPISRRRVYLRDDIKAVFLAHNAPAIGLAVGAGTGAVIGATRSTCCHSAYALLGAGAFGVVGMFFGLVADPFFHGSAIYRSPQDPYQGLNNPLSLNRQNVSRRSGKEPSCLRDGITMQCVQ
jgi:hypothetical protein